MNDVVLMVSEGNFGAAQLLGDVEELLSALPGAEKAGGLGVLLWHSNRLDKASGDDVEGHAEAIAEGLEIIGGGFVMNISHPHMQGLDGKVGNMDFGTAGKKFEQAKGILATRQADEDAVVLVDELELAQCLVKSLPKFLLERHGVCLVAVAKLHAELLLHEH